MAVIHDTTMSPGKLELLAVSNTPDFAVTGRLATADNTPMSGP